MAEYDIHAEELEIWDWDVASSINNVGLDILGKTPDQRAALNITNPGGLTHGCDANRNLQSGSNENGQHRGVKDNETSRSLRMETPRNVCDKAALFRD